LKTVEIRVRELGGYNSQMIGVDLMDKALRPQQPADRPVSPEG
jgi:hypothetical protein